MSSMQTSAEQRLVLDCVDWRSYGRWLRLLKNRPGMRLTYDRGTLEIMNVTYEHESWAHFLGRLVLVLTEEFGMPVAGGGSTTFRRRKRRRGLEPDECYWITHEAAVRGKKRINLRVDPPPDLAIEVDITRSSLNRRGIYAALGIPEVWRFNERGLTFHTLAAEGKYAKVLHSKIFPSVTPTDIGSFLSLRGQKDENAVIRDFRSWVCQKFAGGSTPPPAC